MSSTAVESVMPCDIAALEHLTGPARGTVTWLSGSALDVSLSDAGRVRVRESGGDHADADANGVVVAR
jgi:hypothetical protein